MNVTPGGQARRQQWRALRALAPLLVSVSLLSTWAGASASAKATARSQAAPVLPKPRGDTPSEATRPSPLEQLQQDILAATRMPGVERGIWGIVVQSLDRAERVFELNPRTLLVPASTAKLFSVAGAVDNVGWTYQFETKLESTGPIVNGVLQGDLIVVGSGDPSIGGRGGDDLSGWIAALKALGLQRVQGRVIGDDNLLDEPRPAFSWAWDDLATSGALYGALNLEENRMVVTIAPGTRAGDPVELRVEPFAMTRELTNRVVTGERGSMQTLWAEQRPGEAALSIAGTIPARAMPVRLTVAVGNPTLWFARVLRHRLLDAGILVDGEAMDLDDIATPPERSMSSLLYTHRSRPLAEIVKPLFKDSINLYGEAVLRLNTSPPSPTSDAAIEKLAQRLVSWGMAADAQQLVDGSGLSRRDVVAAESLVLVLQKMYDADSSAPWMAALPVAGVDGTLQSRLRNTPAARTLRAKTGSMSNIRSLAGYVTTKDGEHLAFAILLNNFEGSGAMALQAIDAIATKLASFSRTASNCCSK